MPARRGNPKVGFPQEGRTATPVILGFNASAALGKKMERLRAVRRILFE